MESATRSSAAAWATGSCCKRGPASAPETVEYFKPENRGEKRRRSTTRAAVLAGVALGYASEAQWALIYRDIAPIFTTHAVPIVARAHAGVCPLAAHAQQARVRPCLTSLCPQNAKPQRNLSLAAVLRRAPSGTKRVGQNPS